ncbi:hypothetical protein P2C71_09065, partial [Xanthomonas perforans]
LNGATAPWGGPPLEVRPRVEFTDPSIGYRRSGRVRNDSLPTLALRQANEALTAKNHDLMQLNRENGQWLERQTRLERELAQARQRADAQQRERDALRLAAAEHQALQVRWTDDVHALEGVRTELSAARTELVEERQRREHAEADTLRATVRLSTLEQLLAQLRPAHSVGEPENAIAAGAMPAGK